jgi:hypothetical protein
MPLLQPGRCRSCSRADARGDSPGHRAVHATLLAGCLSLPRRLRQPSGCHPSRGAHRTADHVRRRWPGESRGASRPEGRPESRADQEPRGSRCRPGLAAQNHERATRPRHPAHSVVRRPGKRTVARRTATAPALARRTATAPAVASRRRCRRWSRSWSRPKARTAGLGPREAAGGGQAPVVATPGHEGAVRLRLVSMGATDVHRRPRSGALASPRATPEHIRVASTPIRVAGAAPGT